MRWPRDEDEVLTYRHFSASQLLCSVYIELHANYKINSVHRFPITKFSFKFTSLVGGIEMVFNYFLSRRIHPGGSPESKISNAVLLKQSEEFQSVPDGSRVLAKLETQSAEEVKKGGRGRETEREGLEKKVG